MQELETEVEIPIDRETVLDGSLAIPRRARGLVIFAHGSGSSRFSPRNQFVARALRDGGLATMLLDLLTPDEEEIDLRTSELRFNIEFLAGRVVAATDWAAARHTTRRLRLGYFGSSTGAAAALVAAARRPDAVAAVVSRGGRPDLAGEALPHVLAPTLLIVGARDLDVLAANRDALLELGGDKRLEIVPGASHLFPEDGALEVVTRLASAWFQCYLNADSVRLPTGEPVVPAP